MADRFRSRYGAMLATGCCSLDRAQKSLDLTVIITFAASFALPDGLRPRQLPFRRLLGVGIPMSLLVGTVTIAIPLSGWDLAL